MDAAIEQSEGDARPTSAEHAPAARCDERLLRRSSGLLLPLVRRFVALWVRPVGAARRRRGAASWPAGRSVYALEKRSRRRRGGARVRLPRAGLADAAAPPLGARPVLPDSRAVPRAPRRAFRRSASIAACPRRCAHADARLRRRTSRFDADIVPVSLFWGRAPGRERSWFRLLVAEGWDIGGRFRKVLSLLVNGRNLLLLFGEAHAAAARARRRRAACRAVRAGCRASCACSSATSASRPSAPTSRTGARSWRRCSGRRRCARPCAARCRPRGISRRDALKVARGYALRDRGQLLALVRRR
ncbi:MAG: hypothetical protein MZW92_07830 [Comamonadaceae bacterium]|nr:hypothetical protein [Comamonadaceae bacterium]